MKVEYPRIRSLKFVSAEAALERSVSVGVFVEMWTYSLFGVTKQPPWDDSRLGTSMICFVLKSRRSTIAMRPFARSWI